MPFVHYNYRIHQKYRNAYKKSDRDRNTNTPNFKRKHKIIHTINFKSNILWNLIFKNIIN